MGPGAGAGQAAADAAQGRPQVTRDPGPDDGREEAYDDAGTAAGAAGVAMSHRYAPPLQQVSPDRADRQATAEALQDMADSGRVVHGHPWLRAARRKALVKHRQWERRQNGWAHCRRCGWAVPATDDALKIVHQEDHRERERVLDLQAADHATQAAVNADLQAQLDAQADEIAELRLRSNLLAVACGHPDDTALQAILDQIMAAYRAGSGAQNGTGKPP